MQAIFLSGDISVEEDTGLDLRLVNLITGLELLSIGTSIHDFKPEGSAMAEAGTSSWERDYTLDLLFGDIFYSRAVIYLLKFEDHKVFYDILEALKKLHEGRLKLHLAINEVLEGKQLPSSIDNDKDLMLDANGLLNTAFDIGLALYKDKGGDVTRDELTPFTGNLLLYKTYADVLKYMDTLDSTPSSVGIQDYLDTKRADMEIQLGKQVEKMALGSTRDAAASIFGNFRLEKR